jgi:hypothetical protein
MTVTRYKLSDARRLVEPRRQRIQPAFGGWSWGESGFAKIGVEQKD